MILKHNVENVILCLRDNQISTNESIHLFVCTEIAIGKNIRASFVHTEKLLD